MGPPDQKNGRSRENNDSHAKLATLTGAQDNNVRADGRSVPNTNKAGKPTAPRRHILAEFFIFVRFVLERFGNDHCQQRAAQLTFTSLLAIVPLFAVSFAIFAAFPAYSRLKEEIQTYIFSNFVPQVGSSLQEHLDSFTQQTGQLTAVGILFLIFTAVMLMVSVSNTINAIWRAPRRKNIVTQMLVFWAMITLAPMLFGVSLSLSSYLFTLARTSGVEGYTGSLGNLAVFAPFLLQAVGFAALFLIMPNARVRRADAFLGGIFASGLFELLKKGFGLYITTFPTYQTIYGALATIPIFLVWVYLSWIVVLLAAEVTAALPEWRSGGRQGRIAGIAPLERLISALAILSALRQAQNEGIGLNERRLLKASGLEPAPLISINELLEKNNYTTRSEKGDYLLTRDLTQVTLYDIYKHLGLAIETPIAARHLEKAWGLRFQALRGPIVHMLQDKMSTPLEDLLGPAQEGEFDAQAIDEALPLDDAEEIELERSQGRRRIMAMLGLGAISAGS